MKPLSFFILLSLWTIPSLSAEPVLKNCFGERNAQFFTSSLEETAKGGETPVLLLDSNNQVVGLIRVEPQRNASGVDIVRVGQLSLCSTLETDTFYYAEGTAADLLKWPNVPEIEITQDEGMITMAVSVEKEESYARKLKVNFKAYDVFSEPEDVESQKGQPDFIEDWGIPRATGTFYFYIPKKWKLSN